MMSKVTQLSVSNIETVHYVNSFEYLSIKFLVNKSLTIDVPFIKDKIIRCVACQCEIKLSKKSYQMKTTFSATYFRHLRLHTTFGEDRIAGYFLNTMATRTLSLVCCTKIFTDCKAQIHTPNKTDLVNIRSHFLNKFSAEPCKLFPSHLSNVSTLPGET